ncbi:MULTISPECIES: aldehyde dehydrogenase family protein [unclassified Streptomyces]|uniref:aldehyde dehydrogenase family protein n=1 Tax=unclassified Streptomyces TaxID=2593676 RepID=UPI0036428A3A
MHGTGAVVGEALVRDPRVAAVSFTGSTAVGMRIERASGAPRRGAGRDGRQERPWWCWTTPTSSRPRGSPRRAAAASPARPAPPPPG